MINLNIKLYKNQSNHFRK